MINIEQLKVVVKAAFTKFPYAIATYVGILGFIALLVISKICQ